MDSSTTESVYKHLGNIAKLGNICSLKDVSLRKKPLITGKVIQKLPIVRKSKYQIKDVLIILLKEVCSFDKNELLQFRVIFIEEAAQLVGNLCIEDGDCLAFCDVKLSPVSEYRPNPSIFSKQVVVGLERSNDIANVFYKRQNMMQWSRFQAINSELLDNRRIDFGTVTGEAVLSEHPDIDSSDQNPIPSTSRNISALIDCAENNEIIHSTSGGSDELVDRRDSTEKASDTRASERLKSRNVMVNLMKQFQQTTKRSNNDEDISKSTNEKLVDSDVYQYVKLAQLKKDTRVNVYGIVTKIIKKPTLFSHNKCHQVINIIDDSEAGDFIVTIFTNTFDGFPDIPLHCIIRLHRLQVVEEYNSALNGKISHARDILVFDKDDSSIRHSIANKYTLNDSDVKKVEELKEWALENITNFRPFTSLNSLELKRKKINLRGEVSCVKIFEDRPVVVLRIRDGTKCTVPCERLNLDLNIWAKVIAESKLFCSENEDIDIVVDEPDRNFKDLKEGDQIELLDVEALRRTKFMKTNAIDHLKFFMKGIWENLRVLPPKENHSKELPIQCSSPHSDIPSKSNHAMNVVKKRRLFDPDKSIAFERDDLNESHDKSTSTNSLENNYETNKRKADIDLEKDSPERAKSPRTENKVGNAATSKPQAVAQNVAPLTENDAVLREGSEETENHLLKWPLPMSNVPFSIKVNLISTSPAIDEDCDEQEILSMVKSYCSTCEEFFPSTEVKWLEMEGEHVAFCKQCRKKGHYKEMSFVLTLKTYLQDQYGQVTSAVILGEYAEKFLGCTVADVCESSETRAKVRDVLNSSFHRIGKKNKSLIASITPIAGKNGIKYHVTAFLRLE